MLNKYIVKNKLDFNSLEKIIAVNGNVNDIIVNYIADMYKKIKSNKLDLKDTNILESDIFNNRNVLTNYYYAKNFFETIYIYHTDVYDTYTGTFSNDREELYLQEVIILLFSISFTKEDNTALLTDLKGLITNHYKKPSSKNDILYILKIIDFLIENSIDTIEFLAYIFKPMYKDTNLSELNNSALVGSYTLYLSKLYTNYKYSINPIDKRVDMLFSNIGIYKMSNTTLIADIHNIYKTMNIPFGQPELKKKASISKFLSSIANKETEKLIIQKVYNFYNYLDSSEELETLNKTKILNYSLDKDKDELPYEMFEHGVEHMIKDKNYNLSYKEIDKDKDYSADELTSSYYDFLFYFENKYTERNLDLTRHHGDILYNNNYINENYNWANIYLTLAVNNEEKLNACNHFTNEIINRDRELYDFLCTDTIRSENGIELINDKIELMKTEYIYIMSLAGFYEELIKLNYELLSANNIKYNMKLVINLIFSIIVFSEKVEINSEAVIALHSSFKLFTTILVMVEYLVNNDTNNDTFISLLHEDNTNQDIVFHKVKIIEFVISTLDDDSDMQELFSLLHARLSSIATDIMTENIE